MFIDMSERVTLRVKRVENFIDTRCAGESESERVRGFGERGFGSLALHVQVLMI